MSPRAFALLVGALAAEPARASLFDTYGFGARSTSTGNALTCATTSDVGPARSEPPSPAVARG